MFSCRWCQSQRPGRFFNNPETEHAELTIMTYHIRRKPDIEHNVRLIARDQLEKAINELQDASLARHEMVHRARRRCKKLRGLIRLVRPGFADYSSENVIFRDAARSLSPVRDAQAMLLSYDELLDHFAGTVRADALGDVRERLKAHTSEVVVKDIESESLTAFLHAMRAARQRVDSWQIEGRGFEAIAGGLKKTYRRAQSALSDAIADPDAVKLHAWRKRVKYHWYHTRLLRQIWPDMMRVRCSAGGTLSDLLGDDHDLAVLRQSIEAHGDARQHGEPEQLVIGLIDRRRAELQAQSWPLGKRLFAEKPGHFVARTAAYWRVWHAEGPQATVHRLRY